MSRYRRQGRAVAIKEEATDGVHSSPTLAADALRIENPTWDFESESEDPNETQDGLDAGDPIPILGPVSLSGEIRIRGVATPGTSVPEWDAAMQSMGFARADLAADVSDTAQAGSANSITLAAGDAAAANAYAGMVIELTGGTGAGQRNIVLANDAGTKIADVLHAWSVNPAADTTYTIFKCSVYRPASQGLKCFSARTWDKGRSTGVQSRLIQAEGMVGDGTLQLVTRRILRITNYRLRGRLTAVPANVADPGAATFSAGEIQPVPLVGANVRLGDTPVQFNTMSIGIGAQNDLPDDPAATFGYGPGGIVTRRMTFTIDPMLELLATRDTFADWFAGTKRAFSAIWGPAVAGRRLAVACRGLLATTQRDGDNRGFTTTPIEGRCTGDDNGIYVCIF